MESQLLNTEEAAIYIRRTPYFARHTLKYETPYIQRRRGGPLYFRKSDLDMWIARNTTVPAR